MTPTDWSAEFNKLPKRTRLIFAAQECRLRRQHLAFERDRLCRRHKQSLREIADHDKNCERGIGELRQELVDLNHEAALADNDLIPSKKQFFQEEVDGQ